MSTRSLTTTAHVPEKTGRPDNFVNATYYAEAKQWHLRSKTTTKESVWVAPAERAVPFPQRNSFASGDLKPIDHGREISPERKQMQTRIFQTTTTTQTIDTDSGLPADSLKNPLVFPEPPAQAENVFPDQSGADSSRTLDLGRNFGRTSWGHVFASSSPNLDIINGYVTEDDDEEEEIPRLFPNNLPPVPDLPPPLSNSGTFNPRKPQTLEELQERGMRNASDGSARSDDPLDPDDLLQPAPAQFTAVPVLKMTDRKTSSASRSPKMASHQKSVSQSRLLPLHLNQSPYLTIDKPVSDSRIAYRSFSPDVVMMHWVLFACCTTFPPLWLALAGGAFDSILHVPLAPHKSLLTTAEERDLRRIKMIKILAAILGMAFTCVSLAGFIVGLALL